MTQQWTVFELQALGGSVETIGVGDVLNIGDSWQCVVKGGPPNTPLLRLLSPTVYPPQYETLGTTDANGNLTYTHTVTAAEAGTQYGGQFYMLFENPAGYPAGYDPLSPVGYHKALLVNFYYSVPGTPVVAAPVAPVVAAPVIPAPAATTSAAKYAALGVNTVTPSATSIQYTSDFSALTYLDASGQTVTVPYIDGQAFSNANTIRQAQIAAAQANQAAATNYNQTVDNEQISVTAGRPVPNLPPKPQMTVVSNSGAVTYQDFDPPLHVIVPLVVTAPSSGSIKTTVNLPPDPVVQAAAAQTVIMAKIDAIIAALQAKGIM